MAEIKKMLRHTVGDGFKGFMNSCKSLCHMLRHYDLKRPGSSSSRRMVIFNVDGDFYSGGMADRFKGAITSYAYSKLHGYDYRIRYVYPFDLADYLTPAHYDWRLRHGEYSRNIWDSKLMYARAEHGRRLVRQKPEKYQLHFYGNYDNLEYLNKCFGTDFRWGELFCELFEPNTAIKARIGEVKSCIGTPYISAVFRFQNLLGDFQEYKFPSIADEDKRQKLIATCLDGLRSLQEIHRETPILVTSDSTTFLQLVEKIPGIYVVGGNRVHIGCDSTKDDDAYLNSFVDFFMLSESQAIYSLGTSEMYSTQFPLYAAKIHDIPFERIHL